jgi:hypothetical protein
MAGTAHNEAVEKPYKHHFYIYTQIVYNLYFVFVTRKPEWYAVIPQLF